MLHLLLLFDSAFLYMLFYLAILSYMGNSCVAVNQTWSQPVIKGIPPTARDSHTCTAVGDNLFVFGGTDGMRPLKDLHILDTCNFLIFLYLSCCPSLCFYFCTNLFGGGL